MNFPNVLWNHSHPSVCLSVCLCVQRSLDFLKIGSLLFSDILHDYCWPWYLVTDETIFLKKNWWSKFGCNGCKSSPKFSHNFLEVGSLVFLEIAYNDSLQCMTSSKSKTQEKSLRTKFGLNEPKSSPILGFSPFSEIWFISFPLNYMGW